MTYKTHVTFAFAVATPIAFLHYGEMTSGCILFFLALSIGALAPDLDEEGSYLSRKIPIFPMIFQLFGVTHRGITHRLISVVALLVIAGIFVLGGELSSDGISAFVGFSLGYLLHLVGDMLTKGGINKFFYPISNAKGVLLPRRFRFYTGSGKEKIVFVSIFSILIFENLFMFGLINV